MKPAIEQERLHELEAMARGLYGTIGGLVNEPFEAITIITMIHLMIWLNCKSDGATTEAMLADYCRNFTLNCEANEQTLQ